MQTEAGALKDGARRPIDHVKAKDGLLPHYPRTDTVVQLTRLGGPVFALNPDLIERAEATPDTVVTLVNGSRYVIRESLEELAELISTYRALVVAQAQVIADRELAATRGGTRATVVALHHGDR